MLTLLLIDCGKCNIIYHKIYNFNTYLERRKVVRHILKMFIPPNFQDFKPILECCNTPRTSFDVFLRFLCYNLQCVFILVTFQIYDNTS